MMDDNTLREIQTSLAVLLATTTRMEHQLEQQNGHLRQDRQTLIKHTEQILGLCKDRDEQGRVLEKHNDKLRNMEVTLASRMLTGGAGGAIVAILWAVADWLMTGSVTP